MASDQQEAAGGTYGKAMEAYSNACSMSSTEAGDDLPGLLHNWGVGLHSAGTHLEVMSDSSYSQWGFVSPNISQVMTMTAPVGRLHGMSTENSTTNKSQNLV